MAAMAANRGLAPSTRGQHTNPHSPALLSRGAPPPSPLPAGPRDPPPGFDRSCKSADFLNTYYCYNRWSAAASGGGNGQRLLLGAL